MNCDNARQKGKDPNQCGLQSSNALGDESSASGGNTSAGENFPAKLHYMLSEIERDGLGHIVSWQPHGRCFMVHKQKEFEQKILPFWFRQSKLASFQRQLNIYSFQRLTRGRDKNAYYHELFLRGKPQLARKILRKKIKGQGPRKRSVPDSEPNFYAMTTVPDESNTIDSKATDISPMYPQAICAPMPSVPLSYLSFVNSRDSACNPLLAASSAGLGRLDDVGRSAAAPPFLMPQFPFLGIPVSMNSITNRQVASVIEEALRVAKNGPCPISPSLNINREGQSLYPIPQLCYPTGHLFGAPHTVSDYMRRLASQE